MAASTGVSGIQDAESAPLPTAVPNVTCDVKESKLQVINERDDSHVPFLRGILTRSLTRVGVPFEDAYRLASDVRDDLSDEPAITTSELRQYVYEALQKKKWKQESQLYLEAAEQVHPILVVHDDELEIPFSKGLLSQSLEICAMDRDAAFMIASTVEQRLHADNQTTVTSREIEEETYAQIKALQGKSSAEQYRSWLAFVRSGRPVILLIGGTTGVGKSTLSADLAQRLKIVRTQSTDMLREVMRLMVPPGLLPSLHTSSFLAHTVIPHGSTKASGVRPGMISGYLNQADHVKLAMAGVLKRAQNEQVSLILEGVHIHPGIQNEFELSSDSLVVPMIVAVLKKKRLKKHLSGRGQQVSTRRAERYLEHFDKIWELQSFLLSEADRYNVPIIEYEDEDSARRAAMQTLSEFVARDAAANNFKTIKK